jgi:hypothetical protein
VIDAVSVAGTPVDTGRIFATAERRERHRARLRRIYARDLAPSPIDAEGMEAHVTLSTLRDRLKPDDWRLVTLIAASEEYGAVAQRTGATAASLRIRVLRIRRALTRLAA